MKITNKFFNKTKIPLYYFTIFILSFALIKTPTLANNHKIFKNENIFKKKDNIEDDDEIWKNNVHFEEWKELENESENATFVSGEITILEDGSTRGKIKTVTKGSEAEVLRKLITEMQSLGASYVAAQMLRRQNLEGHANLQEVKIAQHQLVAVDAVFTLSNKIEKDGSFRIPLSSGIRVVQMPQTRYLRALKENNKPEDLCKPRYFEQKIVFILPKGNFSVVEFDKFPNSVSIEIKNAAFSAKYIFQEGIFFIHRQFYIKSFEGDCSNEAIAENILAIRAAAREFNRILTLSPITQ